MTTPTILEKQLFDALTAASEHLDYSNYGDKWERECAREQKLPEQISNARGAFIELYGEQDA